MKKIPPVRLLIISLVLVVIPSAANAINFGIPYQSTATTDDATAVYYNPSGLAVQEGFELIYYQGLSDNRAGNASTFCLKFPYLGFGFQRLYDNGLNLNRFAIPLGVPVFTSKPAVLFLGGALDIWNATDPDEGAFTDWRLGFQGRFFDFVSLGAEASQLNTPVIWGEQYNSRIDLGVA
ncbi:MAG: hypothetical protein PHQ00_07270, partial [Phycisphaerae bacterium]|nr:hypothetical protein [Phycisphaerae bacterium]